MGVFFNRILPCLFENESTLDNLVKIAFQELRHAFFSKGGYDFLTEVFLAIYVEGGTDIGYFFGEE